MLPPTLELVGCFDPEVMTSFIAARADLLQVHATVLSATEHHITLHTRGDPDLVDAFEAACALAPGDNVVFECTVPQSTSPERKVVP
jgi:hypothetical protein